MTTATTDYWIYEDWTTGPVHTARAHRGTCRYCQHGHGFAGGTQPQDAQWHGPYHARSQALQPFVGHAGVSLTPVPCKHCNP
jgi:hypothetical protein